MATIAIFNLIANDTLIYSYESQTTVNHNQSSFRIPRYGDVCVSIKLTTDKPLTSLIFSARRTIWADVPFNTPVPFRQIDHCSYIIENVFDLTNAIITADVKILSYSIL